MEHERPGDSIGQSFAAAAMSVRKVVPVDYRSRDLIIKQGGGGGGGGGFEITASTTSERSRHCG